MRRQIFRILAGLTAFVLVILFGDPAAAEEVQWNRIACLSGAIDRAEVDPRGETLTLAAHLDCADPSGEALYGFASYASTGSGGYMNWFGRAGYAADSTSHFAATRQLRSAGLLVCVVTDYTVWIDCVRVVHTSRSAPPRVYHLAPDELAKLPPFIVIGYGVGSSPACGSCW